MMRQAIRRRADAPEAREAAKVVIAGGFGVGKTTFVHTVSEIVPLRTEAMVTEASAGVDALAATPDKHATTVAMDFGRVTLDNGVLLYLFGTPGQRRFWFMWDDLTIGAIGAVVLADCRRLEDSFAAIDFFEHRGLPFVVAVNEFDGAPRYEMEQVRAALRLAEDVPVVPVDARDRASVVRVLSILAHCVL